MSPNGDLSRRVPQEIQSSGFSSVRARFLLMTLLLSSAPSSLWPPPTGHREMQAMSMQQQQSRHFPKIIINWAKKKSPRATLVLNYSWSLYTPPPIQYPNSTASIFQSEVVGMVTSRSPAGPLTCLHLPGTVTMKRATAWQLALKPAIFIKQTHAKPCWHHWFDISHPSHPCHRHEYYIILHDTVLQGPWAPITHPASVASKQIQWCLSSIHQTNACAMRNG